MVGVDINCMKLSLEVMLRKYLILGQGYLMPLCDRTYSDDKYGILNELYRVIYNF